ncbi:MAG: membrane protein insertase YidC [Verrucomicrobiae bacterium]|nr:membrane protein insertase YidC [Verrucomicrobiae bacterium]NNJ86569.1 membrane protein insertase YidC [Akkermansiaceae bacterium]
MDRKGWIILTICGILLVLNFVYRPEPPKPPDQTSEDKTESPAGEPSETGTTPDLPPASNGKAGLVAEPPVEKVGENLETITSTNDKGEVVEFTFTSHGGGIKTATLLNQYAVGSKTEKVVLNVNAPAPIGALCNGPDGFLGLYYDLVKDGNAVYCEATSLEGLKITKKWSLEQDKEKPGAPWQLKLDVTLTNKSQANTQLANYSIFSGAATPLHPREWENQGGAFYLDDGSLTNKDSSWFRKGFFRGARPLFKEHVEDLEYSGVSNQFFTTLIRPEGSYPATVWAKSSTVRIPGDDPEKPKHAVRSGFTLPDRTLAPNEFANFHYNLYVGPKHYSVLKKVEGNVDEVMNYGWFTPISVFLSNVLNWLHDIAFSKTADKWAWGLSIIALTILIRIAIWPLHNKSTRTMKRMSKLQPLMKDMREKYKDNPQKLNQETMKLYKEYQINPMGGCLPMFLQIPIFFGYYRMLQYAVELRGQSFLWVDDLSMPDTLHTFDLPFSLPFLGDQLPVNLLPILMALTMVLQMKMTPKTGDKMQQRIFMFMPLMFFFFCYNFASALALYWTTQNIFSIGQTWLTNRMPEPELKKRTKPGKPGKKSFMERMAERAEQMQQQQAAQKQGKGNAGNMRNATPAKKTGKKRNPKTGG